VPFELAVALARVAPAASATPTTGAKRQYSDDLSRVFSEALEQSMQTHFPSTFSGAGTGIPAASASGIKSIDVAFNIEGLFLAVGLSVKVVGLPEQGHGYTHNLKRLTEEWTLEAVNYHRYMPYAIVVGLVFLPEDCMTDRVQVTSLSKALSTFAPYRGRLDHKDDLDLLEEIFVAVYKPDGPAKGDVFFVSADAQLGPREIPRLSTRLTFEDIKDQLVAQFKTRNRKLRVQGMP
jgi:hypothetical protein